MTTAQTHISLTDPNAAFSGLTHRNTDIAACLDRLRLLQPLEMISAPAKQRMLPLLNKMGDPQLAIAPVIHVAGTNGKGSVLAYLQAVFEAAGYDVHKFTSPHLVHFNERIVLAGEDISDELLLDALQATEKAVNGENIRFFDAATLAALYAFACVPADIVLLETGMGGKLDSTNIFDAPLCAALSTVSLDHTGVLGTTHEEIATTKCGIAKPDKPFVIGRQEKDSVYDLAIRLAQENNALPYCYGRDWQISEQDGLLSFKGRYREWVLPRPQMAGAYQVENAGLALAMLEQILEKNSYDIAAGDVAAGIRQAQWRGRLQRIVNGPLCEILGKGEKLWLDGGHNGSAARMLAEEIKKWDKPTDIVLALSRKRDYNEVLTPLAQAARSVTLVPLKNYEQALYDLPDLQKLDTDKSFDLHFAPSWQDAVRHLAGGDGNILIAGSLYLAGDVLKEHG
jgi:dihydrofolate synthase/folylpolyglutamate synthase